MVLGVLRRAQGDQAPAELLRGEPPERQHGGKHEHALLEAEEEPVRAAAVGGELERAAEHGAVRFRVFEGEGKDHAVVAFRAVLGAHGDAVRLQVEAVRAGPSELQARLLREIRQQRIDWIHLLGLLVQLALPHPILAAPSPPRTRKIPPRARPLFCKIRKTSLLGSCRAKNLCFGSCKAG